jgi:hypothetical protein
MTIQKTICLKKGILTYYNRYNPVGVVIQLLSRKIASGITKNNPIWDHGSS